MSQSEEPFRPISVMTLALQHAPPAREPWAHRPLLFSIAYRMLGSVAEAEDVVQEAFHDRCRDASTAASKRQVEE